MHVALILSSPIHPRLYPFFPNTSCNNSFRSAISALMAATCSSIFLSISTPRLAAMVCSDPLSTFAGAVA